ncbi:hypothetical protein [Brevundimonas sp.]|uniref:hypothetical protein n=1 Tax=Brevundimonas sp. TaxID=1871086 RepID=UPI00391AEEEE
MSRFSAPADGRLYLFANDARAMYWNNHGLAHVRIEVLARDRTAASSAEQRSGPASSHPPAKAPEPKAADSV